MIFLRALSLAVQSSLYRSTGWLALFRQPPPQLQLAAGMTMVPPAAAAASTAAASTTSRILQDLAIWFAVPKQKVSRHKKRLKTTLQNRIPLRRDIVVDGRTGEMTTRHKMPANWKEYLPKML
jgi:ribosomal protein L32